MALGPNGVKRGGGEWRSHTGSHEFLTRGECPHYWTGSKPTVGGGRTRCPLAWAQNTGGVDCGGQELYGPSGQWQSGEYHHTHSGAAVRVPCPPFGRPCGLPSEPRGARRDAY